MYNNLKSNKQTQKQAWIKQREVRFLPCFLQSKTLAGTEEPGVSKSSYLLLWAKQQRHLDLLYCCYWNGLRINKTKRKKKDSGAHQAVVEFRDKNSSSVKCVCLGPERNLTRLVISHHKEKK